MSKKLFKIREEWFCCRQTNRINDFQSKEMRRFAYHPISQKVIAVDRNTENMLQDLLFRTL